MASQAGTPNDRRSDTRETFTAADAFDLVAGDRDLFLEIVNVFLDDYPRELTFAREAIAQRSPLELQQHAHHLKGSVCAFGSGPAVKIAAQLEEIGRAGDFEAAPEKLMELERAIERLRAALVGCEWTPEEG
jgi:two-component system, sensor histidine kinase and response regulator